MIKKSVILLLTMLLIKCSIDKSDKFLSVVSKNIDYGIIVPILEYNEENKLAMFYLVSSDDVFYNLYYNDSIYSNIEFYDFLIELKHGKVSKERYSIFESCRYDSVFFNSLNDTNNICYNFVNSRIEFNKNLSFDHKLNVILFLIQEKKMLITFDEYSGFFYFVNVNPR